VLSDDEFCVALRRRLLYEDPAGQQGRPCTHKAHKAERCCGNTTRQKYGSHAVCCEKGPGFTRRHHRCRDALADWCKAQVGPEGVLKEQHVRHWDRLSQGGETERAILDVVLPSNPAGAGPIHIDISIVEPTTSDQSLARSRAKRAGQAAADRERTKHRRYPGAGLLPAVLEAGGRWGSEFRRWARAAVPPGPHRSEALAELRQSLAVALQQGVAAALLGGAGCSTRSWAW
jgi:hypothetical protein